MTNKRFILLLLNTFLILSSLLFIQTAYHRDNIIRSNGDEKLTFHFLDIGHADSIFIQVPGNYNILIDAGHNDDANYILAYLQNLHIKKIDLLIQTHPHPDHIGAMDEIIYSFDIGSIIAPNIEYESKAVQNFYDAVSSKGLEIKYIESEDHFHIGPTHFHIFHSTRKSENINLKSLGIHINYRKNKFLLMGDNEGEVLNEFQEKYDLKSDLIKIGHHGGPYSSPLKFIQSVNPKFAIITAKTSGSKNYPHEKTLNTLEILDIETHITDCKGSIIVTSDGETIDVSRSTHKNSLQKSLDK